MLPGRLLISRLGRHFVEDAIGIWPERGSVDLGLTRVNLNREIFGLEDILRSLIGKYLNKISLFSHEALTEGNMDPRRVLLDGLVATTTTQVAVGGPHASRTLAIIMVGLPARGKTYISRKIARYLTWLGSKAKIFNVGNYRRDVLGAGMLICCSMHTYMPMIHAPVSHSLRTLHNSPNCRLFW